jgi:L-arabinose transport system substrate-binding protein
MIGQSPVFTASEKKMHGFVKCLRTLLYYAPVLTACIFLGCEEKTEIEEKIKIGFIVKRPEEKWFQDEWDGAQSCADKYGFELVRIGATDGEKTLSAIDNLGVRGVHGFVICTPDVRLGPAIMARADSYGMKVIAVDDVLIDADGSPMDAPYLGMDAHEVGRIAGAALREESLNRSWDITESAVLAVSFDELETCRLRIEGGTTALTGSGFPRERIFDAPAKTTDVPGSFDAADVLITQHPYVKKWMVFSYNDEGALGAVRALENRGFDPESVIGIGIGGSGAKIEFEKVEDTGFYASVFVNAFGHGYRTAELLYNWIDNGAVPPAHTSTAGEITTKKSYLDVIEKHGL